MTSLVKESKFESLLEDDKRATTNVQNGLVFSFYSVFLKPWFQESPGEKFWKSVEKCGKVWKSAETIFAF